MINTFLKSPLPNTLAVVVLIALVISWLTSLFLSLGNTPVATKKGGYAALLPLFSLLGLPAAVDLLQIQGVAFVFAIPVFLIFLLNIVVPVLGITGNSSRPIVVDWYKWSIPLAVLGGLAVAGYLTFIESTGVPVMCGPSGGCETVQGSKYAILFGILPIGVLGLMGYLAILAGWLAWQFGPASIQKMAVLSIWAMCIFGVLFSMYLTFLEPFVIGATCMWCISSAVLMISLLLVSTPPAQQALAFTEE